MRTTTKTYGPVGLLATTLIGGVALSAPAAGMAAVAKHKPAPHIVLVSTRGQDAGGVRVGLRVATPLHALSVRLNGRQVARAQLPRRRGQRTVVSFGAARGARFGRNHVVVTAVSRTGRRQVVSRVVVLRRSAPLVGVREPGPIVQGRAVRLDARRTRAARRGRLRFRWRVVGVPKGAGVKIRGATSARPQLTASDPGRYRLALTVTETSSRGATASAAACAVASTVPANAPAAASVPTTPSGPPVASTPLELLPPSARLQVIQPMSSPQRLTPPPAAKTGRGCVTEILTADVMPNTSPLGAVFDSRAQQGSQTGIRIGAQFFPILPGRAEVVLLDATTLEPLYATAVPPNMTTAGFAGITELPFVMGGREVLEVLTGMPGCCGNDGSVSNDGFTIVQRAGQSNDTSVQNQGLVLGEGNGRTGQPGELTGYLQPDVPLDGATPVYAFVSPDRVAFDTQAGGPRAGANTMQIGSATYAGTLPAGTTAGYQVVVTDAALRPQLGTPTVFGTNGPNAASNQQQEKAMAKLLLDAWATPGDTVFVQSIGKPRPASPESLPLSNGVALLGGSEWMFLGLDGSADYALVGEADPFGQELTPVAAAEASPQWTGGGRGALQGVLRRGAQQSWRATLADSVGTPSYGLAQVVYQDPTPWPQTDTPGKIAATTYLADQLGLVPGPGSCYEPPRPDFRSSYCDDSMSISATQDRLSRQTYPSGTTAFSRNEFVAVQNELGDELDDVADVRAFATALQAPFGLPGSNAAVNANTIAGKVIESIPVPKGSATSGDLSLASAILYVGSEVPEVGEALGPIASVLDLAAELTADDGEPSPDWDIQTAADQIGGEVNNRLQQITGRIGSFEDILLSDYGKLSTTSANARGAWGVNAAGIQQQESTLQLGIEQWMWMAIAPSAYDLVVMPGVPQGQPNQAYCVYSRAPYAWRPWSKADARSVFFPLNSYANGRPTSGGLIGMLHGSFSNRSSNPVNGTLANEMFGPPSQGGAGLVAPWFYAHANWTQKNPKMIQPSSPLVPGYCGVGTF